MTIVPPAHPAAAKLTARRLAKRWARSLANMVDVPMSGAEADTYLSGLVETLLEIAYATPFQPERARLVGMALVDAHFRSVTVLRRTVTVLVAGLTDVLTARPPAGLDAHAARGRVAALVATVAEGFTQALQARTLAEQEEIQRAALASVRTAEHRRQLTEARFRAVFSEAAVGIGIIDLQGRVIDVNAAFAVMIGYSQEHMRGHTVAELVGATEPRQTLEVFQKLMAGAIDHFRVEAVQKRPDGQTVYIDLSMSMVRDRTGRPQFIIGVGVDITERRRLADRLWYEARHDALTGLPNRTLFYEHLTAILASGSRAGLCYLDLDGFKNVNDSLGHDIGDRLLVSVAQRLDALLAGEGRMVARIGGDEFVVLTDQTSSPGHSADNTAETVLASLAAPVIIDGHELSISASIGVVDTASAGTDARQLMRAADITLYRAKAEGKARWTHHDPQRSAQQVTLHSLATSLPSALARGEFFVEYQPLVALADGRLHGVEALVRWQHPTLGLLLPSTFITVAEDTGHISELGHWVLRESCRQASNWRKEFPDLQLCMSVNVAVGQLRKPTFADDVMNILKEEDLPSDQLQLEITESAVLGDTHGPLDSLRVLADAGVRLAIDDFGTGYSNLAHLIRLPAHDLKIAGSFLKPLRHDAPSDTAHDKIVSAIISLAHTLGLTVTAEGVEDQTQADRLRALHCDKAQGWLFARPDSAQRIHELIVRLAS